MERWQAVWTTHSDIFIASNFEECPAEKKKNWRLPSQFDYYLGGGTSLRVGIIASAKLPKEEDFLLAGMLWGSRLSNGVKTVIYFVAPDFSPFFLQTLNMLGGIIKAHAVYWREKLTPSLYLIPENINQKSLQTALGEERLDWKKWRQELNPVAQYQLDVVKGYVDELVNRQVRVDIKPLSISLLWGNFEIAEIRRKGKKFEIMTKAKWERDSMLSKQWQCLGWVDASGVLNQEFRQTITSILDHLERKEKRGELKPKEILSRYLRQGGGIISSLWGIPWEWPWLPKERGENWVNELGQWFYFLGDGQLSVVFPILEKAMVCASHSLLLSSVLKNSDLLCSNKLKPSGIRWNGQIIWLTTVSLEEDLRLFQSWLKNPEQFPIWTLPDHWQASGLDELNCRSHVNASLIEY
ncbi:hypothetical protein [Desulfitobacterium sp.]|uniref:hypothetical protein n=1 Tax=Desulfitobacterium sp. TaxID=49981 RepID=UPI002B21722B|nr:hypothetical protein [Desulfitobacterium sp.]MEA4901241.1 hypothetical protein [Desulfitobacterium sp.]